MGRVRFVVAGLALLAAGEAGATNVQGSAESSDWFGAAVAVGDFDCSGEKDLAVLVAGENNTRPAVNIIYDDGDSDALWQSPGSGADKLGGSLAVGDIDGDACDDLAIGLPYETAGGASEAGAVYVILGNEDQDLAATQLSQGSAGIWGNPQVGDHFGYAVAIGSFDGDPFHDLAIGVPDEDTPAGTNSGVVHVLHGTSLGVSGGSEHWDQDSPSIEGAAEAGDRFGFSLAAGNFNGGLFPVDDLAIGAPYDDVVVNGSVRSAAGTVNVIYGELGGLTTFDDDCMFQGADGVLGTSSTGDWFGFSLASGDFDADGRDDLAIGIPGEDVGSGPAIQVDAGSVYVIYSNVNGLATSLDELWNQNTPGIAREASEFDNFGWALAAGPLDADTADDLAIGVPNEDVDGFINSGVVQVIYGSLIAGLATNGSQVWMSGAGAVPQQNAGYSLAIGDLDDDDIGDLAIGVPKHPIPFYSSSILEAGEVHVLFADDHGLTAAGDLFWTQDSELP